MASHEHHDVSHHREMYWSFKSLFRFSEIITSPHYWLFVRGIQRRPVVAPQKSSNAESIYIQWHHRDKRGIVLGRARDATLKNVCKHDDVMTWKRFSCYWPFVSGKPPVPSQKSCNSGFDVSLMLAETHSWINCCRWFEMLWRSLWRHRNETGIYQTTTKRSKARTLHDTCIRSKWYMILPEAQEYTITQ